MQGGHFDHADRLFHSIADTWTNVLLNSSDVKELIPEFYYHPEFLLNANNFDFGARQVSCDLHNDGPYPILPLEILSHQ